MTSPTAPLDDRAYIAAVVALARSGIPTDIQELLIAGDPMRGIPPRALVNAIRAYMAALDPVPGWQDISTCPKDGSHFLARQVVIADEYDEDRLVRRGVREEFTVVAYWVWGGVVQFPWNGGLPSNVTYILWRPLPAAPMSQEV